jgi:hypothetical protein
VAARAGGSGPAAGSERATTSSGAPPAAPERALLDARQAGRARQRARAPAAARLPARTPNCPPTRRRLLACLPLSAGGPAVEPTPVDYASE